VEQGNNSADDTAETQESSLTNLLCSLQYFPLLRVILVISVIAVYNSFGKISFSCEKLMYIVFSVV